MSCFSVGKSSPWIQKFQELKHPRSSKVTIKYFVRSDRNMQHSIWSIIHAKNAKLESKKVIRSNYHPTRKTGGRVTLGKKKKKRRDVISKIQPLGNSTGFIFPSIQSFWLYYLGPSASFQTWESLKSSFCWRAYIFF